MRIDGSDDPQAIDIWQIDLDDAGWDRHGALLDAEERSKAARFRTLALQQRYSRCRSALRLLLSRYCGSDPAAIAFQYGPFGKPELRGLNGQAPHFNVSHSRGAALIAIAPQAVGIDIEWAGRKDFNVDELIDIVCHASERSALAALPPHEKANFFYRLWTRKEAYCKMTGNGLQQALPQLHFGLTSVPDIVTVLDESGNRSDIGRASYFVRDVQCATGFSASVCGGLRDMPIRSCKAFSDSDAADPAPRFP